MYFGESFTQGKTNLFGSFALDWKIKYIGLAPMLHTLREMTEAEKKDKNNMNLKGVRTFYFLAHHSKGLPEMNFEQTEYDDF